jgi:GT2 family glycosyltransferase
MYYNAPNIFQSVGGIYNRRYASSSQLGMFEQDFGQYDNEEISNKIDFPVGASMFVSAAFIEDVGLMCEDFFLYFEEIDWVLRGRVKGWKIGYCWLSRIFHKEGATIGSSSNGKFNSELSDYYGMRNRMLITKKHFPSCLWSVYLSFFVVVFNRIRRGQIGRLKLIWKVLTGKQL